MQRKKKKKNKKDEESVLAKWYLLFNMEKAWEHECKYLEATFLDKNNRHLKIYVT